MKKILSNNVVERSLWTLAQASLGLATVELVHVPVTFAPLVAAVLAVAKSIVKEHFDAQSGAEAAPAAAAEVRVEPVPADADSPDA